MKSPSPVRRWLRFLMRTIDEQVQTLNTSKVFAGVAVMTINIASKFVKFKFSKSVENYLKYTFSRDILIFCIVWMGSRDIYIASCVTLLFSFTADKLCNEESSWCVLPESFINYHDAMQPSEDEVANAKDVLKRAGGSLLPNSKTEKPEMLSHDGT